MAATTLQGIRTGLTKGFSNFVPNGSGPDKCGVSVPVAECDLTIDKPLHIGSMTDFFGIEGRSILRWEGSFTDPASLIIGTGQGHGSHYGARIRNFRFYSPNGALSVSTDCVDNEKVIFENCVFIGGGVDLGNKSDSARFINCWWIWQTGTTLNVKGSGFTILSHCTMNGPRSPKFQVPAIGACIHATHLVMDNGTKIEMTVPCAQIRIDDYQGYAGSLGRSFYLEPHGSDIDKIVRPDVVIGLANLYVDVAGGTDLNPWKVENPLSRILTKDIRGPIIGSYTNSEGVLVAS